MQDLWQLCYEILLRISQKEFKKCRDCHYFFEYENAPDNLIKYKCVSFNKDYKNKIDEELKKAIQEHNVI